MPKRKRTESVANVCDGIDGDCDAVAQHDDEINATIDAQNGLVLESVSDTNECETIVNAVSDDKTDSNHSKLRRKSNRISKPIQRSLDSPPNQLITAVKKIAKQNCQITSAANVETDKQIVKTKSEESISTPSSSKAKSSRKWEMWTEDDAKWFFEALCEHGKDFTNIQSYIAQRCEKKGIHQDLIKNKEQVRHYYYRTWHKIANSLNISHVVDKATQELYGLINYAEIWKKFGSKFDNKLAHHLPQLVNFGHAIFKVKGKSVRIKTPICKALKKIHNINVEEKSKSNQKQNILNLPKEVCVELHPATNESWLRVHSLSQNPRVRTKLSLQRRLSTLLEYLEKRWSQSRIRDSECRILCGTSLPNVTHVEESHRLRIRPQISDQLITVSISKLSFYNSQTDLSLSAYLKKLYNQELKSGIKKTKSAKSKEKSSDDTTTEGQSNPIAVNEFLNDNCDANEDQKQTNCGDLSFKDNDNFKSDEEEPIDEAERSLTLLKMLASMNEPHSEEIHATDDEDDDPNKDEEERDEVPSPDSYLIRLPEPPDNATLAQWLSGKEEDHEHQDEKKEHNSHHESPESNSEIACLSAERAKKGWCLSETGSMTIGELYLLFKCPQKIILEYLWEPLFDDEIQLAINQESVAMHETNADLKSQTQDVLSKLLFAANLSLMNLKKPANTITQTQKKKRIKPIAILNDGHSSQLLSSVISNTIFNDNSELNKKTTQLSESDSSNDSTKVHNFIVPTSPAPKAVSKTKNRTICGDPALIQEALRQLQSTKYTRRQRRSAPKTVFSHQNKALLPGTTTSSTSLTSASNSPVTSSQPIYMIPTCQQNSLLFDTHFDAKDVPLNWTSWSV